MDAPAYHFALAKKYLEKSENAKAAVELKEGRFVLGF